MHSKLPCFEPFGPLDISIDEFSTYYALELSIKSRQETLFLFSKFTKQNVDERSVQKKQVPLDL